MLFLRQSTAVDIVVGPVWSREDGEIKTDLAYNASGIVCNLFKNGVQSTRTLTGSAGAGYWRASGGRYLFSLATGNTDTVGEFEVHVTSTDHYSQPVKFTVLSQAVYDELFGSDALSETIVAAFPTLSEAAGAIWDEDITDHDDQDSAGEALIAAAEGGSDPWNTTLTGYGAGTAGKIVADNLDAKVSTRAAETGGNVAAIKSTVDTNLDAKVSSRAAPGAKMDLVDTPNATALGAIRGAIEAVGGYLHKLKIARMNKSIEGATGVTYRNDNDTADYATQTWDESTGTRGPFTEA